MDEQEAGGGAQYFYLLFSAKVLKIGKRIQRRNKVAFVTSEFIEPNYVDEFFKKSLIRSV